MAPSKRKVTEAIEDFDLKKPDDVEKAAKALREIPDEHLHLSAALRPDSSPIINNEIWLSKMEIERRAGEAASRLAMKTTRWSVGVGGVIAILAAIVGSLLSK